MGEDSEKRGVGERFEESAAIVRRRRGWLLALQAMFPFFVPAVFWLGVGQPPWVIMTALGTAAVAAFTGSLAWLRWMRVDSTHLVADEHGLTLAGKRVLTRKQVRSVTERTLENGHVVLRFLPRFSVGTPLIEVEVESEEKARALVAAMRMDAARAVVTYATTRGTSRDLAFGLAGTAFGTMAYLAAGLSRVVPLPLLLAMGPLLLFWLGWSSLTVSAGADGVRLAPAVGRARFVSYGQIKAIDVVGTDVALELTSGQKLAVCFGQVRGFRWADSASQEHEASTFVARVRERIGSRAATAPSNVASSLSRAGRNTSDWVSAIRRTTDGAASFRDAAVPAEELLAVIEDETAAPDSRAGAAVALRRADDNPISRERMRIAAQACAQPKLRIALESVARADDDDAMLDALDQLAELDALDVRNGPARRSL